MSVTRSPFQKATKKASRLRLALVGPSGSGKTYSALKLASLLGQKVAVIDSERGSASKYADKFDFDVCELESFDPREFVRLIQAAEGAGYDVIVIDSLSHAWMGKDGALEIKDTVTKRSRSGNSFDAWREVTPLHNALVEAMLQSKAHIIATMRAKTEYVQEKDERGKTVIRKVGLAPVQRDGIEYEFDVVGDLDADNNFIVTKSRCEDLTGKVFPRPGEKVASILRTWLSGAPASTAAPSAAPAQHNEAHDDEPELTGDAADLMQTVKGTVGDQIFQAWGLAVDLREHIGDHAFLLAVEALFSRCRTLPEHSALCQRVADAHQRLPASVLDTLRQIAKRRRAELNTAA